MYIDFHILKTTPEQSYFYLAKLSEKGYLLGNDILFFTKDTQEEELLNNLLWTFKTDSFLPHHIIDPSNSDWGPVLISHCHLPAQKEVLINLTNTIPNFYNQFSRVIELICEDKAVKEHGRKKYREYQRLGCEIRTFNIN